MLLDQDAALAALPGMLARAAPDAIRSFAQALRRMLSVPQAPSAGEEADLERMLTIFETAALKQAPRKPAREKPVRTT